MTWLCRYVANAENIQAGSALEWPAGYYASAVVKLTCATRGEKRVANGTNATDKSGTTLRLTGRRWEGTMESKTDSLSPVTSEPSATAPVRVQPDGSVLICVLFAGPKAVGWTNDISWAIRWANQLECRWWTSITEITPNDRTEPRGGQPPATPKEKGSQ